MTALAALALLAWVYLLALHGRFWQAGPVLAPVRPAALPDVDVVIPARDEAEGIGDALRSMLAIAKSPYDNVVKQLRRDRSSNDPDAVDNNWL